MSWRTVWMLVSIVGASQTEPVRSGQPSSSKSSLTIRFTRCTLERALGYAGAGPSDRPGSFLR
jgi:hypothetical protein